MVGLDVDEAAAEGGRHVGHVSGQGADGGAQRDEAGLRGATLALRQRRQQLAEGVGRRGRAIQYLHKDNEEGEG